MNKIINTVVPLMTALVQKPGLDSSAEQINEAAKNITALMTDASNKTFKVLGQDDPKFLSVINQALALLVAKTWVTQEIDPQTSERITQVFISVIDNIDIDPDQAFGQENMAIGIDTAGWVTKCLPPIIELREIDPDKTGRGKLLLGQKPYEENIAFLQGKMTAHIEQVTQKMIVKDPDSDKSIGQAVADILAVIIQSQFDALTTKVKAIVTTEEQKKFLKETTKYPEGILIKKSFAHLDDILKICFPGTRED